MTVLDSREPILAVVFNPRSRSERNQATIPGPAVFGFRSPSSLTIFFCTEITKMISFWKNDSNIIPRHFFSSKWPPI